MRKLTIALITILACLPAFIKAQGNYVYDPNSELPVLIDSNYRRLGNINLESVTSGILMDFGRLFTDESRFKGDIGQIQLTDEHFALYSQVYFSQEKDSNLLLPLFDLVEDNQLNRILDIQDISILNVVYQRLKDSAFAPSSINPYYNIDTSSGRYTDKPSSTRSGFESDTLFSAGTFLKSFNSPVNFQVPVGQIFSNIFEQGSILIDFGNGSGFQTVIPGVPLTVTYLTTGQKMIKVRRLLENRTFETAFQIQVNSVSFEDNIIPLGPIVPGIFDPQGIDWWDDPETSAEVQSIVYGGVQGVLDKPFILVEGFDPLDEISHYGMLFLLDEEHNNVSLLDELLAEGFDIVPLNLKGIGGASLYENSQVVKRLIEWVNQQKAQVINADKNIIAGYSMGGVLARMALAEYEKVDPCGDHDCKLYVSIDAPHRGAEVSVGSQQMLRTANDIASLFGLGSEVAYQYLRLDNDASKQLTINHVMGNNTVTGQHLNLLEYLDQIGMPRLTRNVAVSLSNPYTNSVKPGYETEPFQDYTQGDRNIEFQIVQETGTS